MATADVQSQPAEAAPALPDYLTNPDATLGDKDAAWRYGKAPDYSKTREVWEQTKHMTHQAGSLPQLVENLVKNWEVEASFKPDLKDWRTIDHPNYTFAINGGVPQSAEHMLEVGTYNAIIDENEYYSPKNSDFSSSHKTFKRMMPTFAWEVLEVYSGPPKVAFKWRHWGVMKNDYVGFNNKGEKITAKAHGGPIEITGITIATVNDKVQLQAVDTYFDPMTMFKQIAPEGTVNKEIISEKVDPGTAYDLPSRSAEQGDGTARKDVDEHLAEPADVVHPHPKDMEKAVHPSAGQAVAVPAEAQETKITHEEMSGMSAAECPFLNRE
ncbi:hypothetical protein K461DRAFT_290566 [Myriangium duriaei CBS 260.36]|uniref:Pathogen-related protein n=1 Tax=Myriangium duriaei CBS 260.36 TaxID=1168546 RepID=A0A9P4J9D4_9PEZI|nr:hypothetical protein K461DRAFT_290566 [Myriangium duriaei CBS 260.36]